MSERDDLVYVRHILDAITKIQKYTRGMDKEAFQADDRTQDAVIRQLEIIGEACKRLSPEFRSKHGGIPWSSAAGMRDVLIHDYLGVDLDIVWDTVEQDLPGLVKVLSSSPGI